MARAESQPYIEPSPSALIAKHLQVFRDFDASRDGSISISELGAALEKVAGIRMPEAMLAKFAAGLDADGNGEICFSEFEELAKRLSEPVDRSRKKNRVPRLYLVPEQYDRYSASFQNVSGEDGKVTIDELQDLFVRCSMNVPPEKLKQIMTDVDDDGNGSLDEVEFMTLIIKAAGMKKRRLGPGICPLSSLVDEGWSLSEMRRAGYDYKDFVELGYPLEELTDVFSACELRKAGVPLMELLLVGWDCVGARVAGFELSELVTAGCTARKIRLAGWDDPPAASQMRQVGFKAADMRLGGWQLSELRLAGYSLPDLRLGGFSPAALSAVNRLVVPKPGRRNTFAIRAGQQEQG
mmetsp:Transcript_76568/g.237090  ORF Transcript_76568/g.237090 Transcript_76568/m.237090 type:complete len:352 (-) Transcript_76568:17-1072(-)